MKFYNKKGLFMNYKFVSLILLLIFFSNTQPQSLDSLAVKHGTDKSSKFHSYTKTYEKYFSSLRYIPMKFLEIGFAGGASAHMWEDYFTRGEIHFIDNNFDTYKHFNNFNRTMLHILNQEDSTELANFIKRTGGQFDIIIDDGGHTMHQQITSFIKLFPEVKSGGVYVIEDLHTSYNYIPDYVQYGSTNQKTAVEFLQNLVHCVNAVGARTGWADFDKCPRAILDQLSMYDKEIESIHFHSSLCFIFKR